MLSNNEKYIFTSELALAISNGLQVEDGLKMLVGFDADVSICAKKLEDIMKQGYSFTDAFARLSPSSIRFFTCKILSFNTGCSIDRSIISTASINAYPLETNKDNIYVNLVISF